MIEWLQANITKYKGNPDRMFIWAHSAGNGPLGQYIGRPDLYGVGVRGAIFMSGNPVNFGGGGRGAGGGAQAAGAPVTGGRGAMPRLVGPDPQPGRRLAVALAAQRVRLVHRRASTLQVQEARLA